MGRVFGLAVLACPRCGGRLRLIATVEDPTVVGKILAHLGLLHPVAYRAGPAFPRSAPAAPSRQQSVRLAALDAAPAGRLLTVRGCRRKLAVDDWPGR